MKTINHLNRRDFLGLVAGSSLLINNANEFMAQPPQNRIRRNIAMIDNPNLYSIAEVDAVKRDVEALKKAVDDMKHKYSETDFRHWKNQAGIHTNWCPHQNWFFLPWHRAYLDYFEQICRKISGYDDFMIPYWDWSISRKIPSVFLEAGSPLLETDRKFILQEATNALVGETMVNSILKKKDIKTFSGKPVQNQRETGEGSGTGSLERVHNHIHSGYIGGLMRIPATAAFDPVFWVHHSNVDRLWEIWLRTHKEVTKDTDWLDFPLGNFFDPNGTPVKKKVRDLLYISKLGYTYPNLPEEAEIKFAIQNINIPNGLTVFRGGNQKQILMNQ